MKRALISVSDKTGIVEFAKELVTLGYEIISTGGTKKSLDEAGIKTSYDTISFGPGSTTSYQELAKTTYKSLFVHGVFFKLAIASGRAAVPSEYEFQHFTGYAINSQAAKFPGQGYFTGEDSSPVINTILPVE